MRYLFVIAVCCLSAVLAQAQAYRWVDANGIVHYSDRPVEGAEEIELKSAQTFNTPRSYRSGGDSTAASASGASRSTVTRRSHDYQSLIVVHPADQETLWNIGASLDVSLQLTPSLAAGDQIRLIVDGVRREDLPGDSQNIVVPEVYRGRHTLLAQIEGPDGAVRLQSPNITFYVQQRSVLNN